MFKASRQEVLCDIDSIVGWTCRKDFVVSRVETNHVYLSGRELQKILSLSGKSERTLCFLLLICERAHKRLTQKQIAQLLGITDRAIRKLVTDLSARRIVRQLPGTVKKTAKGFYCKRASRYHVDLTQVVPRESLPAGETNYFWINVEELLGDFRRQYYRLLLATFSKDTLFTVLTRMEKDYIDMLVKEEDADGICGNGNPK